MLKVIEISFPKPDAGQVRVARGAVGLTQAGAAKRCGLSSNVRWAEYESGKVLMDGVRWALFLLVTDQHPAWCLVKKTHAETPCHAP